MRPDIDEVRRIFPNATRKELSAYYVSRAQHEYALLVSSDERGLLGQARDTGALCQDYLKAASYFGKAEDLRWFIACQDHVWDVVEEYECEGFI